MDKRVRNPGQKLLWLPLNSGDYLPIPPGQAVGVSAAQLNRNGAVEKLKSLKLVQVEEPDHGRSRTATVASSESSLSPAVKEGGTVAEAAKGSLPKRSRQ